MMQLHTKSLEYAFKNKKPKRINNNINSTTRIGQRTNGGMKDMPQQINGHGAKTVGNRKHGILPAWHITIKIGLLSPTQSAFCPNWNLGIPLIFAKILSM